MKFSDPTLLNLLWLFVVAFGIITFGMHQRKKIVASFIREGLLEKVMPGYSPERRWAKACMILFAAALAIIALAGPLAGFRWEKIQQKGVDIMIALDCSKSMLAEDIKPSRMARAKHEIIDLLRMMKSDRAGLVAFSGRAILQCPLTLDHEAFHIFLNVLEPGYLPMGGTNLEEALRTAYAGFEKESDTDKAIILITDGENTSGDVETVANEMADKGVKVFSIGVGSADGAPIPEEDGGFKKDRGGRIVMSKVDETALRKIAAMTSGAYVRSVAGDMDLDLIYTDKILGTMERKKLSSGRKKVWENRFQWFLFPCILLLFTEFIVSSARRDKNGKTTKVPIFILAGLLGLGLVQGNTARAGTASDVKQGIQAYEERRWEDAKTHFIDAQLKDPDNETIYYNIGAAAYMNNEFDMARDNFAHAAGAADPQLRQKAMYNLANTLYRLGRLDEAISGYEQVLKEFPEDTQAKENLEFVRRKKEEQQQKKQSGSDKKNRDEQDSEQNKDSEKSDKNKSNQSESDQNKQGHDKENSAQQQQSGQRENQDQKEPQKNGSQPDQQNPAASKQADPTQEDQEQENQGQESQAAADTAKEDPKPADGNSRQLEHKLNRLEDQPGRAMMPKGSGQKMEKDW